MKHKDKLDLAPDGIVPGVNVPIPLDKLFREGQFLKVKSKNITSEGASVRVESVEYSGNVDYVTKRVACIIEYSGRRRTFTDIDLFTKDVEILERG